MTRAEQEPNPLVYATIEVTRTGSPLRRVVWVVVALLTVTTILAVLVPMLADAATVASY